MTQSQRIEILYNCTLPTKLKAYWVLFFGNSMVNGYSTNLTQLRADDQDKYFPVAEMDYWTFAGNYLFRHLGRADFSSNIFGNYACCMTQLNDESAYADGHLYAYQQSVNGSSIVNGEQPRTWSVNDANSYCIDGKNYIDWAFRFLQFQGYDCTIIGINWSGIGIPAPDGSEVQSIYEAEFTAFMAYWRAAYPNNGGNSIPFVFGITDGIAYAPPNLHYRNAVIALSDPLLDKFDIANYRTQANDTIHQRSHGVMAFGRFVASALTKFKTGNNYPTVSDVALVGNLKNGVTPTISYLFNDADGDAEGLSVIFITYANDTSGTSETDWTSKYKGEALPPYSGTLVGKYVRARIIPISASGARVGKAVYGSWQGPIVA